MVGSLEILCPNNGDLKVKGWMFLKGLRTILTSPFVGYRIYIYRHAETNKTSFILLSKNIEGHWNPRKQVEKSSWVHMVETHNPKEGEQSKSYNKDLVNVVVIIRIKHRDHIIL
jgi:hypothetical protein